MGGKAFLKMKNKQNIGYILLCLLLCNSVVTTYSSIEHNAKTYGKAKFLKKVQDTLVKLNEPQRMQANANAKIAKKLNLNEFKRKDKNLMNISSNSIL